RKARAVEHLVVLRVDRIDLAVVAARELDHHRLPERGGTHARADDRDRSSFEEGAEPFRAGVLARRRLRSAGRRRAHFLAMLRFERFRSFMICRTALSAGTPVTPPPACVAELA